ncbi:MAG TPA: hypothetical protein IAC82_13670 [Candidatus Merdivicinus intestinigallinarum]|nr:hypothetical protein [Candidatus Merdivicinus intestinigallinarum]
MRKSVCIILACVLLLSLSGCGAGNAETSGGSEPNEASESGVSADVSDSAESSEQETASGSAVKLLAREYIHRTDQDDQISSYRAPVYTESALYDGFERYTPDDILLETVDECTYEMDEAGRTLLQLPADQLYQVTYLFDESGRLMESKSEDINGTLVYYWYTWTYDDSGLPQKKTKLDSKGNETSDVWNYIYDGSGNIVRREDAYGAWTEFTYDDEGYPLTSISYDQDGEQYDEWSSFEYEEVEVESLPEFMGSTKQWILADLVY